MNQQPEDKQPFSQKDLESPAYRQRLMRKLNCLIAVLEVASAKVRRSLESEGADSERLGRIQQNLTETLAVCQRAKLALENRESLPSDLPAHLAGAKQLGAAKSGPVLRAHRGRMVEMSSNAEFESFQNRTAISQGELRAVDFDELARQLFG